MAKRVKRNGPNRVKAEILAPEAMLERDTSMFKDWIKGDTVDALATKYTMSVDNVRAISRKHDWRQLKRDLRTRAYSKAIEQFRDITVKMAGLLADDINKIAAEVKKNNRQLIPEERNHIRQVVDRLLKENRLEDGKPTDTVNATIKTELVLPPGVKSFGIIPPASGVVVRESSPEEIKQVINLDDVEDEE